MYTTEYMVPPVKEYLDRFTRFAEVTVMTNTQTDRQTNHAAYTHLCQ